MGWPFPSKAQPWPELNQLYEELAEQHSAFRHMLAIVVSVRATGADRDLAAFTSMHDLMVRSRPVPVPPYDLVAVRSPGSLVKVASGTVLIEHLSTTGHNDRIIRPDVESVPLFWRYMIEKFGIDPAAYTGDES